MGKKFTENFRCNRYTLFLPQTQIARDFYAALFELAESFDFTIEDFVLARYESGGVFAATAELYSGDTLKKVLVILKTLEELLAEWLRENKNMRRATALFHVHVREPKAKF